MSQPAACSQPTEDLEKNKANFSSERDWEPPGPAVIPALPPPPLLSCLSLTPPGPSKHFCLRDRTCWLPSEGAAPLPLVTLLCGLTDHVFKHAVQYWEKRGQGLFLGDFGDNEGGSSHLREQANCEPDQRQVPP